ncbi:MAG: putative entry exclusion protein TrbK-alt [Pseudolabrys sp.]|nr:putative entry exclusion protein TrbK-alt [Pseudolabrys sp.]
MDGKTLARLGAIAFVAVAITATAIELTRKEDAPPVRALGRVESTSSDPLRGELFRCARLGEAGQHDAVCLRAWADNRERFLAPGSRPAERLPTAPVSSSAVDTAPAKIAPNPPVAVDPQPSEAR